MNINKKIAVLGGGGRTGKYLVNHLLNKGYSLKILLRNIPENGGNSDPFTLNLQNPLVEIVRGDATDPAVIQTLLTDCSAVLSTIGQRPGEPLVASTATENIIHAMYKHNARRYVLVAGVNVDTPFDKKSKSTKAATEWMKNSFPAIHEDRAKAYEILMESETDWTLVRLPMIEYTSESFSTEANTEDCEGQKIGTADIAFFLEKQLSDRTYIRQAPFLYNVE